MPKRVVIPGFGERALIVGQTGSGKTELAKYLLWNMPSPVVVYDTKDEPALEPIADLIGGPDDLHDMAEEEPDIVIVKTPPAMSADPAALDELLQRHYQHYKGWAAYLDEAYMFSSGAKTLPGLTGLLTRGRSRGIATVACTQRPRWVSRFMVSEAQHIYLMRLVDQDDRDRVGQIMPEADTLRPERFHFYHYRVGDDSATAHPPITMVKVPERESIERI